LSVSEDLTPSKAANTILRWMRVAAEEKAAYINLDTVREGLPLTPYGKGVKVIKPPMASTVSSVEGMLVCNPNDPTEWGIFYSPGASPERQRFTIAHELGHFVLHRAKRRTFNCDKAAVHFSQDTAANIEREADEFASNLLMPGDVLRERITSQEIDLHLLSGLAKAFGVSFEALCIRFIKYTDKRAILLHWDNGFLKYEWRSKSAILSKTRIRRISDPAEPLRNTVAAEESISQEWDGLELPAAVWCVDEQPYMKLREFKHSYNGRDRVLTLLILEDAEPRSWDNSWKDEESFDSFDKFTSSGQHPVR
jgi:Zn-dependent peptidase ImmA (M78 family)